MFYASASGITGLLGFVLCHLNPFSVVDGGGESVLVSMLEVSCRKRIGICGKSTQILAQRLLIP